MELIKTCFVSSVLLFWSILMLGALLKVSWCFSVMCQTNQRQNAAHHVSLFLFGELFLKHPGIPNAACQNTLWPWKFWCLSFFLQLHRYCCFSLNSSVEKSMCRLYLLSFFLSKLLPPLPFFWHATCFLFTLHTTGKEKQCFWFGFGSSVFLICQKQPA